MNVVDVGTFVVFVVVFVAVAFVFVLVSVVFVAVAFFVVLVLVEVWKAMGRFCKNLHKLCT